jgi:hypothetical protein
LAALLCDSARDDHSTISHWTRGEKRAKQRETPNDLDGLTRPENTNNNNIDRFTKPTLVESGTFLSHTRERTQPTEKDQATKPPKQHKVKKHSTDPEKK